ncbi:MAG: GAF domain-containing protein [Syntrophobacterales bacterium]|jgi:signal transduction histidine kinase|nr:GAF domain-containing protein [Syntrophobacterales bacterium]
MAELIYTREDLRNLVRISSLVNSSLDTQEALDNALKGVEQMLDAEVSSIFEVDPAKGELFFRLARGAGAGRIKTLRLKIGEGIAGWVAQTEKPLICADTSREPRFFAQFDARSGFQTRSILCVPLKSRDRLIGVLEVLNKNSPAGFTDEDLELMTIMGNLIGPALENARLYSRLKEKLSLTMDELKVVEQRLLQSERLAALGKLSQGVAHEVRNPVMIIGGFVRRFQRHLATDDPAQEVAGLILGELNRLERMVAEIEAFAAAPLPDLKPRDLAKVVDQVLAETAGALEARQITVERRMAPDLPQIPLDERLLGEALRLLIDNAMEAMPADGRLTLEIAPEPQGLRLSVRDTGVGIPPEDIPYLFDPFFSSKPSGTGMGLTKVHQVVADHHGEIQINSAPGQGTEVNIRLPRWQVR